jgi:uncharacterized protein YbaR (Trm112 family)/ubiquinone/menaquinone biosynthesis C-methylase UbiE
MRIEHLGLIACPDCKTELKLIEGHGDHEGRIKQGTLLCTRCRVTYPIINHIPRFVSSTNYSDSFGFEWTKHAKTQYDSYSGTHVSETRFFGETKWPRRMVGQRVLEVGCGSGRFTEQALSTGATVLSLDSSVAVDANYSTNGNKSNLLVVQADIYRMPLKNESVDRVFCFGVLQHTPDVESAFFSLLEPLGSRGHLAIDLYSKRTGLRGVLLTPPKYWIRPFSLKIPTAQLYEYCKCYLRLMWPLAKLVHRIPRIGLALNWRLLIPDYIGVYALSDDLLKEWALLDLFDMLSPTYDNPQTLETVKDWFEKARLTDVEVKINEQYGIEGRARKP